MYVKPQLSREEHWAGSLVNLPNSFFHFLSKLKNVIVNSTVRLPFLKVTGTAQCPCWKNPRKNKPTNQKISAANRREMCDGPGGPLRVQHQRLQLEMPREAAESMDAGRKRISQWSQIC